MRRLISLAAFALFLTVPLWAQHGGGHAGGGHGGGFGGHAGFGGGHVGGFSGGHISGGMRSGGMRSGPGMSRGFSHGPSFSQRGFQQRASSNRPFMHDGFHRHGHRDRDDDFRFRNNCFGFACRGFYYYPWAYSGFYDPYWWWDSDSSYSYDEAYERNLAQANQMNQQSLEEQRLRRQEEADGDQDIYRQSPEPSSGSAMANQQQDPAIPATVLVFRDQHKQEVRNYAIVGQTLWSFGLRTQKIPLADLDLAATTKANDERGLTFRIPALSEAQ